MSMLTSNDNGRGPPITYDSQGRLLNRPHYIQLAEQIFGGKNHGRQPANAIFLGVKASYIDPSTVTNAHGPFLRCRWTEHAAAEGGVVVLYNGHHRAAAVSHGLRARVKELAKERVQLVTLQAKTPKSAQVHANISTLQRSIEAHVRGIDADSLWLVLLYDIGESSWVLGVRDCLGPDSPYQIRSRPLRWRAGYFCS
jgi:hypothetical protein